MHMYVICIHSCISIALLTKGVFRARASYAYNIKNFKWDPQFNVEYIGVAGGNFDKSIRAGISTDHKLLSGKIKIGYFYEHNPQLLDSDCHTVSIGFKF